MSKKYLMWIVVAAVAVGGFFGYQYWRDMQSALPKGIASGNGRIEAKLVDIAAKEPLRVKEILVDEGALVKPGEVLVRMDTATLEAQLAEAEAERRGHAAKGGDRQGVDHQEQGSNRARQDRGQTQHRARRGARRLPAGAGHAQNGAANDLGRPSRRRKPS